jgi:streptomycin 6-kinase
MPEEFVQSTVDREGEAGAAWLAAKLPGIVEELLQRAQPSTLADVEDGDEVVTVAGRLNRRPAIPAPPGLPRLREQAEAWEKQLRGDAEERPHALPRQVLDAALATVRELGRPQPDTLIHGDLHALH